MRSYLTEDNNESQIDLELRYIMGGEMREE